MLGWGQFLTAAINFSDHRLGSLHRHQGINRAQTGGTCGSAEPTAEVKLLTEIRDLLRR